MKGVPGELAALGIILVCMVLSVVTVAMAGPTPRYPTATPTPGLGPVAGSTALPSVVSGPLNGMPVPREIALRRPVAVILDNFSPDARPQAGIVHASLTFETVVEGGITRLMSLFQEQEAVQVGPIRSARPYFVSLAESYHALLAHAGGSPASLLQLQHTSNVADIEALGPHPEFHRSADRAAPHNLYSSTAGIRAVARQNGLDVPAPYHPLAHKTPAPLASRGQINSISIDFSTPDVSSPAAYLVAYHFNRTRDTYSRLDGGQPAVDAETGRPIEVNNVVDMETDIKPIPGDTAGRVSVRVTGRGTATVFRDGLAIKGFWSRPSDSSPLSFIAADGTPIALNQGSTWVEITAPNSVHTSG